MRAIRLAVKVDEEALQAVNRMTEGECFYAAAAKGLIEVCLAGQGARPVQQARWLKLVDRVVASPRWGECEASVPPPVLCSGA